MGYTVGQVARLAGVTTRTLHHYDEIGLLNPSGRTHSGYRTYDDADLGRLQRILFYRELELSLDRIADLLDADVDPVAHLRRQHRLITERIARLQQLLHTLETTMEANKSGVTLAPEEMLEVFGDFDPGEYASEAEERWGDSDAWRESQRRTRRYDKQDWQRIGAESGDTNQALVAAMQAGEPADGETARALAEEHRQHISRWFYDCTYEMHRGLAEMYVADPRFAKHYDDLAPGLAAYLRDAIIANADHAASS